MTVFEAVVIAVVEGVTEFLPISSTGHMIITQQLLGMEDSDFLKIFMITIQFGAILSVVVLYWRRFFQSFDFYLKLFLGFLPAVILGALFSDKIDELLEKVSVVAINLLLGGIVLIFIDKWLNPRKEQEVTNMKAVKIGLFQCIAMLPGVSRSAATIIGGMVQGLTRRQAAEFSFFLAVPTMFAASAYKLFKGLKTNPDILGGDNFMLLLLGNVVAFIVAMISIKFLIGFLQRHGFKLFGWYRIVLGVTLLVLLALGVDLRVV